MMAESIKSDASGCPPAFSIFPPFIPTMIKQRLASTRYASIRAEETNSPPQTASYATGDSTPRPSSSGSGSTVRHSEDSSSSVSGEDIGNNRDAVILGVPANQEMDSGLRWNRVNPALNLLRHAGYEAQQPQCESRLVRSLYLHAIAYLLSALPDDLTSEETATLRGSLPEKLKPSLTLSQQPNSALPARSYLHRLLASSIVYFCLLLQLIMPFMKQTMVRLYEYDRSHRITERFTIFTLSIAEKVSRGSVSFGSVILNMCDGKPGNAISDATSWWLEGIAGGIYEGVGEGMVILGFAGPGSISERPSHWNQDEDGKTT
ncbi:hypothetical protein BJY04DRAFT_83165 [Aspergillus karnatakaensis]|uniref:uncharacterized protein n=1 Tax=Aspergillus karnatakaensis TaxID=1810916 RepID=UPI003CCD1C19